MEEASVNDCLEIISWKYCDSQEDNKGNQSNIIDEIVEGGLNEVQNVNTLLISDTGFRYIIPVNDKKFTPMYKQMC